MNTSTPWIQTAGGRRYTPFAPRPEQIVIFDIAHALAHKARFNGHAHAFYSVAEHSVLVADALPPHLALWGLLHDAAEAYLPDIASPIKPYFSIHLPPLGHLSFAALEALTLDIIAEALQLPRPYTWSDPAVVAADLALLETERRALMAPPPEPWATERFYNPAIPAPACLPPDFARRAFLDRYDALRAAP